MVLRKPYAFLIKHFKLIHIIILFCISIALFNLNDISTLFRTLQRTSTYVYAGADIYINHGIYVFLVIALVLSAIVYYLFKIKKKPNKLYLFLLIYLIATICCYAYIFRTLKIVMDTALSSDTIILIKDLTLLLSLPGYVFVLICLIRGIGFNIKKFNFSKDLDDLQISDKDREEFEFTLGQNNYKYMRTLRRSIREFKYYILENKFAISLTTTVVVIILGVVGFNYYKNYIRGLQETESAIVDNITYTVLDSYVTKYDFNGDRIKEGYKYVVVKLSLYNSSLKAKTLNLRKIVLANGKLIYRTTNFVNNKFYDLGKPYIEKQVLPASSKSEAIVAFEVPEKLNDAYTLKVQYSLSGMFNNVSLDYKNFMVNVKSIDKDENVINHNLNENIIVNPVDKNYLKFNIKSYLIKDSYSSKYIKCKSVNTCYLLSNVTSSNSNNSMFSNKTMIILDYDAFIDNEANYYSNLRTVNNIFGNYMTIVYKIGNKIKSEKAIMLDSNDIDNKLFISVDRDITSADEIYLQFDFRNDRHIVNLK